MRKFLAEYQKRREEIEATFDQAEDDDDFDLLHQIQQQLIAFTFDAFMEEKLVAGDGNMKDGAGEEDGAGHDNTKDKEKGDNNAHDILDDDEEGEDEDEESKGREERRKKRASSRRRRVLTAAEKSEGRSMALEDLAAQNQLLAAVSKTAKRMKTEHGLVARYPLNEDTYRPKGGRTRPVDLGFIRAARPKGGGGAPIEKEPAPEP